jgi:hypothetical protein
VASGPIRRGCSSGIRCSCGASHSDGTLTKYEWQPDGRGGAILLAHCPACKRTIAIAAAADASFCGGCHRVLVSELKLATPGGVYCIACARASVHAIRAPVFRRSGPGPVTARDDVVRKPLSRRRSAA